MGEFLSDWFNWSNAFYLIGLIVAGLLTMVTARYRHVMKEIRELASALQRGYEDNKLTKAEKNEILKEAFDVVGAIIKTFWKF